LSSEVYISAESRTIRRIEGHLASSSTTQLHNAHHFHSLAVIHKTWPTPYIVRHYGNVLESGAETKLLVTPPKTSGTLPYQRTQPQPCSASQGCSPGNWPLKSSTSHSSSQRPSCSGKVSRSSQIHRHLSSSCFQDRWNPRFKEEIYYSCGIEGWIHKWARSWYTMSKERIFPSCIAWLGDMVEGEFILYV
jgi:hypothetical protein